MIGALCDPKLKYLLYILHDISLPYSCSFVTGKRGKNSTIASEDVACHVTVPPELAPEYYRGYYAARSNRKRFFPFPLSSDRDKEKNNRRKVNGTRKQAELEKEFAEYQKERKPPASTATVLRKVNVTRRQADLDAKVSEYHKEQKPPASTATDELRRQATQLIQNWLRAAFRGLG